MCVCVCVCDGGFVLSDKSVCVCVYGCVCVLMCGCEGI